MLENILIAVVSILVGIATTFIASRHYYRRSVDKELTPFIQLQSNVLSHIDKEVKSDLHIEYKGVKVENLQQVQFLIANTGERAIKDIIKPLKLQFPNDIEVMDASILYISPEGRSVTLSISEPESYVEFDFPLLNKDEFFIFKLLLKGSPAREDLIFSIVADDLPPKLAIRRLTYNQIEKEKKSKNESKFDFSSFVVVLLLIFFSANLAFLAHSINTNLNLIPIIETDTWKWINSIPITNIASSTGYTLAIIFGVLGILIIFASIFDDFEFPKSKKFKLPKEFTTDNYSFNDIDQMMPIEDKVIKKSM